MGRSWVLPIIVAGVAALGVAMLGGTITDLGPWYQSLEKPDWNPPNILFPIAWTTIFTLAAVAAVATWRAAPSARVADTVIGLFALNGFLNVLWSLIFFRMQRPDWAFAELMLLWLSVAALILFCARYSRLAGIALVPYLAWVTIAGALNWSIVELNGPF